MPVMPDDKDESSHDNFDARLAKARQARHGPAGKEVESESSKAGVSQAFRIGVDLMSALLVGTFIGWFLDDWLGTKPWFLLIFLLLGGAAGMLNVYRTAMRMVAEVEEEIHAVDKKAPKSAQKEPDTADLDPKQPEK